MTVEIKATFTQDVYHVYIWNRHKIGTDRSCIYMGTEDPVWIGSALQNKMGSQKIDSKWNKCGTISVFTHKDERIHTPTDPTQMSRFYLVACKRCLKIQMQIETSEELMTKVMVITSITHLRADCRIVSNLHINVEAKTFQKAAGRLKTASIWKKASFYLTIKP